MEGLGLSGQYFTNGRIFEESFFTFFQHRAFATTTEVFTEAHGAIASFPREKNLCESLW